MLGEGFIFSTEKLLQNCYKESIEKCITKNYNKSIIKLSDNKNIFSGYCDVYGTYQL